MKYILNNHVCFLGKSIKQQVKYLKRNVNIKKNRKMHLKYLKELIKFVMRSPQTL